MNERVRLAVLVGLLAGAASTAGQQAPPPAQPPPVEQPRFRSGANLVRVDAYVTADGAP